MYLAEALTGVIFGPLTYFEMDQAIPQETAEINSLQPSPSESAISKMLIKGKSLFIRFLRY